MRCYSRATVIIVISIIYRLFVVGAVVELLGRSISFDSFYVYGSGHPLMQPSQHLFGLMF